MKAAVIGLGMHGQRICDVLGEMPGIELAGVVDVRESARASTRLSQSVARASSIDELWQATKPDVVCIATHGPSHADIALRAMELGARFIMVEKPMACSVDECDRMMDAASRHGVRLSVDQSRRHDPMYRWLRDQIRGGAWGALRHVYIQRPGVGLGCLATHSFDLVAFLADRGVKGVIGFVDPPLGANARGAEFSDPGGHVLLDLGDRVRGTVVQIEDGSGPMSVELDLTAARVRIDEKLGTVEVVIRDDSVKPPSFSVASVPERLTAKTDMKLMLHGVLAELVGSGPLDCDAVHGRLSVEVLVAAYLSHERGNVCVALPLAETTDRKRWLPVT